MNIHVLLVILGTSLALASSNAFVLRHSGGTCIDIIKKANFEYVDLGTISEADCASRCEADAQCNFYQTLNQQAYNSGWPPLCQHYRNAYCDPATLTKNHPWWEVVIKESGLPPVKIVTSGPPMTASCSSQPLDYCLRTTWEGGDSPYAPSHNYIWRLADVLNGEPVFVQDGKETEHNGALGFIPDFNLGQNLAGYCAGQTWGAIVLDKSPGYPFINDGVWNWGVAGSCTGTETADILEVLRGQRDSITTAFRARTNSYHAAHRDVKIEVLRDAIACGGRFYSDALFSKSESEQCKIMEAVLPGTPTNEPTVSPTSEPSNMPTMNPTLVPTSECGVKYTHYPGMNVHIKDYHNNRIVLSDDDLIPTDPECVTNDYWTSPFCRDGKFPQGLAIGIDRCKVACAARPKCKSIVIAHPTRITSAECYLYGEYNDQDPTLDLFPQDTIDFYTIEEDCESETRRNLGVGRLLALEDTLFQGDEAEFQ